LAIGLTLPLPNGDYRRCLAESTGPTDIDGRAATFWGLVNAQGGSGLTLDPGQQFRVDLSNALDVDTIIHWHGQIPPNAQDGVPDIPLPMLKPGEMREFDCEPMPGTYWMHSHVPAQEMELLAAPLIVRSAADLTADRQEVVLFLHDFSFRPAAEILAEITGGDGSMAGMDMGAATPAPDAPHDMNMSGMAMDLNDFNFDAYLANDRTLNDPEVIRVDNGGRVRLRIINAAAATVFWIDTGAVDGRLVAVDGHEVQLLPGRRFGLAMGQRLDIELDLPNGEGAFPVLALREGAVERTGIILATAGATIEKLAGTGETAAAAFDTDLSQEAALRAMTPLSDRPADATAMLMLGGSMQPYLWTINGQTWGNHTPISAKSGQRVEFTFHNMSMMAHPMHLHGHTFQVVALNGKRFAGAMRDTVQVPPMAMVTVAVDAGEAARWIVDFHPEVSRFFHREVSHL
jgi:FtsP/CotA-like multicopper oxidase with cupredoxin domain